MMNITRMSFSSSMCGQVHWHAALERTCTSKFVQKQKRSWPEELTFDSVSLHGITACEDVCEVDGSCACATVMKRFC